MPSLMLRGLDAALTARIKAYARLREISAPEAAALLLDAGLRASERASRAAHARSASMTANERSVIARTGAAARHHQN